MSSEDSPLVVQSLIGKNNLSFYLECLNSLTSLCQEEINLLLHTDGSLDKSDIEFALNQFEVPSVSFRDTEEAKQTTLDHLEGRPNCQKLRQESLWGIEFFDPLFANPSDPIRLRRCRRIVLRPLPACSTDRQSKMALFSCGIPVGCLLPAPMATNRPEYSTYDCRRYNDGFGLLGQRRNGLGLSRMVP